MVPWQSFLFRQLSVFSSCSPAGAACSSYNSMQEIKGFVSNIIYRNEGNGYTVFEVETASGDEVCTGFVADLSVGESCTITGEPSENPRYGPQFKVASFRSTPPEGTEAIRRYLASGAVKGIKDTLAQRIVDKFGEDTLRIMEEEPERLAEIKGISMNKAREISETFRHCSLKRSPKLSGSDGTRNASITAETVFTPRFFRYIILS